MGYFGILQTFDYAFQVKEMKNIIQNLLFKSKTTIEIILIEEDEDTNPNKNIFSIIKGLLTRILQLAIPSTSVKVISI